MSEQGFGGQTVGMEGKTEQSGFGEIEDQSIEGQKSRREQGYGGGSAVGGWWLVFEVGRKGGYMFFSRLMGWEREGIEGDVDEKQWWYEIYV